MQWLKLNSTLLISIGLFIIISLPAILPLLHHGFFQTDDGEWMIIRFSAFYQALHDGQFPVRFLQRLNFDYGYPVATFLYPGFMYAGIPLHLIKIGFVDTIKFIIGSSLVGTTLFIYLWLQQIFKNKTASIIGAIASLYLPYHLYDSYTRGSVGEVFALLWVAFIFWMIERKNIFFVSIGIGLLLIAHNTMALLFLPVLFIYALLRNSFSLRNLVVSFLLGSLLASFFIIPAVFELPLTTFSHTTIANPSQHFASVQLIGIATLVIFFLALVSFFSKKKLHADNKVLIGFILLITFLTIMFASSFSSIFWQVIPSSFIQFPFRLLSYLVFSIAFLTAFIVAETKKTIKRTIVLILLLGLILFSALPFVQPKLYFDRGEGYYYTNDATTTVQDEYMPIWVQLKALQRSHNKVEIIKGQGNLTNISYTMNKISFVCNAKETTLIRINTIYWPGWNIFVDNKQSTFSYANPQGVMEVSLTPGSHTIRAAFGETPLRLFSDVISVISLVVLLTFSTMMKTKNGKQQRI